MVFWSEGLELTFSFSQRFCRKVALPSEAQLLSNIRTALVCLCVFVFLYGLVVARLGVHISFFFSFVKTGEEKWAADAACKRAGWIKPMRPFVWNLLPKVQQTQRLILSSLHLDCLIYTWNEEASYPRVSTVYVALINDYTAMCWAITRWWLYIACRIIVFTWILCWVSHFVFSVN